MASGALRILVSAHIVAQIVEADRGRLDRRAEGGAEVRVGEVVAIQPANTRSASVPNALAVCERARACATSAAIGTLRTVPTAAIVAAMLLLAHHRRTVERS